MNILDLITDLRLVDVVILILVIFIFAFLFVLTTSLLKKNKELRCELTKVNNDIKESLNDNAIRQDIDVIKQDIKKEVIENNVIPVEEDVLLENLEVDELIKKEEDITEILEDLPEIEETGPYKKNVLREISARGQTSPVNIGKEVVDVPKVQVTSYVKPEVKEEMDVKNNLSFVEEVSRKMEEEVKPQTIELTDYERQQEEEAIISYQELIKAKDRIYKITDDEEIDSFIDELKEFRDNL